MTTPFTVTGLLGIDLDTVQRGLEEATSAIEFVQQRTLPDDHPAVLAWDNDVLDDVAQEVREQVAQLLLEAVERRLPWTFTADKVPTSTSYGGA